MTDTPAPIRTAPIALWRVMEAFLHTLHALFGAPEDVAAEHTLMRDAHALLAGWLRCAEAMLRRLLLIEAAAYGSPASSPQPAGKAPAVRARKLMTFAADQPETWRVSFRCLSSPARGGSPEPRSGKGKGQLAPSDAFGVSSPARGGDKKRFYSAWPLAERYEALLRVFNDPTAYARRLARKLHAVPHRACELLRADEHAQHRIDCFEEAGELAEAVTRRRFSSA